MTSLQVVDAALDLNLPCSNLRAECHGKLLFPKTSKDHDTLEIEGTKYIQMHPNTLDILDVLLELSQQSTSPLYVAICHNMSPYRQYVTIIQPAFSLTSGLYCKRKSMVWKTFLAKELMMQRGSWAPQEILIPG